jgi:AGZA family xanthine/uracil permease-like MFS transporter
MSAIARYFKFDELQTNYKTEFIAGLTTFFSMAYILFVNPTILGDAGMDKGAIFTVTALASAIATLFMGIVALYPIALAPGMGVNAFFAYSVVLGLGIPWQTALAGVLVASLIFILLTMFKIREQIIDAIPSDLKAAISAGIGLFITFIGLKNAGLVVANESTLVAFGHLGSGESLLTVFGLIVTAILMARKVPAGIFIGMVLTTLAGILTGLIQLPSSLVSAAPSISSTFGQAIFHLGDINSIELFTVVITFLLVTFFDATGTIIALATQAGFVKDNKLPRAGRALMADAVGMTSGAILGTSPVGAYVESSSGIAVGGRSGFTAVVTGFMFLLAIFFSPLLSVVTNQVTAPALIMVGVLMAGSLRNIDWDDLAIAIPSFFTVIGMAFTYSIADGIAVGFILYPIMMAATGRAKQVHPLMYALAIIFIIFLYLTAK